MWDDEINKKIKDAADQYHPAYDETAWDKMELLLNEHLPVKNERKRRYFLFLLVALLAVGSFYFVYKKSTSALENPQKAATKNNVAAIQLPQQKSLTKHETISASSVTAKPANTIKQATQLNRENTNQQLKNAEGKPGEDETNKAFINARGRSSLNKHEKTNTTITPGAIEKVAEVENNTIENTATGQRQNTEKENITPEKITAIVNTPDIKEEITTTKKDTANTTKEVTKNENNKRLDSKKNPPKTNKSFGNNFAIGFSAGPDVSSVEFNKTGKIAINYGAGVNYALSARFTLRTGFYVSEKIYSADRNEYYAPPTSPNLNYLYDINANCKVYEIPVTVSYNFGKAKNHLWFASGGLSSYLMKKESYDYYYKYPSGNVDSKSWSISNQNQNYFSVLDLSAGYEYSFNKRVSLITEPYLKIPLSGIGAGKVKLNSGGILFTFMVRPF